MYERQMRSNGVSRGVLRDNVTSGDARRLRKLMDTLEERGLASYERIGLDAQAVWPPIEQGLSDADAQKAWQDRVQEVGTITEFLRQQDALERAEKAADRVLEQWGGVEAIWDRAAELPPVEVVVRQTQKVEVDDLATLRRLVERGILPQSVLDRLTKSKKTQIGGVRKRKGAEARTNPGVGALALALPNPAGPDSFPPDIEEISRMARTPAQANAAKAMRLAQSMAASHGGAPRDHLKNAWAQVKGGHANGDSPRANGSRKGGKRKARANVTARFVEQMGGYPAAALPKSQLAQYQKRLAHLEKLQVEGKRVSAQRIATLKAAVEGKPNIVIVPQPMSLTGASAPIAYSDKDRAAVEKLKADLRQQLAKVRTVTHKSGGRAPASAEDVAELKRMVKLGYATKAQLERAIKGREATVSTTKVRAGRQTRDRIERRLATIENALKYGTGTRRLLKQAGIAPPKYGKSNSNAAKAMKLARATAARLGGSPKNYLKDAWAVVKRGGSTIVDEQAARANMDAYRENRGGSDLLAYGLGGLGGFVLGNFAGAAGTHIPLPMGDKLLPMAGIGLLLWAPSPVRQIPQNWRWGLAGGMAASVLARGLLLNALGNLPLIGGLLRMGTAPAALPGAAGFGNVYDAAFGRYLQDDSGLGRYLQDDSGLGGADAYSAPAGFNGQPQGGDPVWAAPAGFGGPQGGDPVWAAPASFGGPQGGDPVWAAPAGLDGDDVEAMAEAAEMSDAELAANGMAGFCGPNRSVAKVVKVTPTLARKITASGITMGGCNCPNQPGAVCMAVNRKALMSGSPKAIASHSPVPMAPSRNTASGPSDVDVLRYAGIFGESVFGDASALPGMATAS